MRRYLWTESCCECCQGRYPSGVNYGPSSNQSHIILVIPRELDLLIFESSKDNIDHSNIIGEFLEIVSHDIAILTPQSGLNLRQLTTFYHHSPQKKKALISKIIRRLGCIVTWSHFVPPFFIGFYCGYTRLEIFVLHAINDEIWHHVRTPHIRR